MTIELVDGCSYAFPTRLVQDLAHASTDALAVIDVNSLGLNLHFPALDTDLPVSALLAGVFGTRRWMTQEFARVAGQAKSPAKTAAARANGAKGGRPRKTAQA